MLIGQLKMHKLGVACGIAWNLRLFVVWFSYQLLNSFWEQAKELYSGVNNLKRIYDLHQNYFSLSLSDLSLEDYYNKFKGVCEELNIYQPISSHVKTMKKQRYSMHVARFLSGLPKSLNTVKSQILASPNLPSLSEVFGRLQQATLFDSSIAPFSSSSTDALPSSDKSAFTTYTGSNRGGHGGRGRGGRGRGGRDQEGRGSEQGGRGRGRGLRKCTYCDGENHKVDFCWELYGKPSAHQASFQVEESPSQSLPPTSRVVSIPEEEYNRLLYLHSNSVASDSTTTLAQQSTSTAYLATQDPWVIDSGATDHMTSTLGLLSNLEQSSILSNVTLANGLTTIVFGLGIANLGPNLSLFSVLYIPNFPFNLLSISKLTKILNCATIFLSTHCIFLDLKTGKIIGGGHKAGGL